MPPVYSGEAEAILLDDARVERVEIKQQDDAIVEASFGVKHETTTVLGLLSLLAFRSSFLRLFCLSASVLVIAFSKHALLGLARVKLALVRA